MNNCHNIPYADQIVATTTTTISVLPNNTSINKLNDIVFDRSNSVKNNNNNNDNSNNNNSNKISLSSNIAATNDNYPINNVETATSDNIVIPSNNENL